MFKRKERIFLLLDIDYRDISPFLGSIVKNNLKFGCGTILIISPFSSTPRSPIVKTPLGSKSAFNLSKTAGLHKFTFSSKSQQPSCRHYTLIQEQQTFNREKLIL